MKPTPAIGIFGRLRAQFAFVIALAMLPAGLVAILQAVSNAESNSQERAEELASEVRILARAERDLLIEVRETMRSVGRQSSQQLKTDGTCGRRMTVAPGFYEWMSRIVLLDKNGTALCGADGPFSIEAMPAWKDDFLKAPRFTLAQVRRSRLTGERVLIALLPVPPNGSDAVAIATGIKISAIRELSPNDEPEQLPFALIGNRGSVIIDRDADNPDWLPTDIEPLLGQGTVKRADTGRDGVHRSYVTYPLVPGEVWAMTGEPQIGTLDLILSREGLPILVPLVLWAIAVGAAFIAVDRLVTRHIRRLQRIAVRIGGGDFDTPTGAADDAPHEIAQLGRAIGQMAEKLSDRESRLRELLSTQKSLLLEVHHRVKNNLQMISSLMNIQLRRVGNDVDREMLKLVQDRIHGLAMVHQNLYATERLDHVALHQLVRDVSNHLSTSLRPIKSELNMDLELDPVTVDAVVATPVALFLTEAMGNVFKHAAAPGVATDVHVRLTGADETFCLTIVNKRQVHRVPVDNTVSSDGLGSRLMEGFAKQLGGKLDWTDTLDEFGVSLTAPIADRTKDFEMSKTQG